MNCSLKMSSVYLIILLLLPHVLTQCNIEKTQSIFKKSIYDFNSNLISRIAQDKENHFVTSPLSVWTLIAAVAEGAEGNTLKQIRDVLHLSKHTCFINKNFKILNDIVTRNNECVLERSGGMFVDKTLPIKEEFVKRVSSLNLIDVFTTSFEKFEEAASNINSYVRQKTHGVIDEIVSPEDLENKYLLLIDVIYFKGLWMTQFKPKNTKVSVFNDDHGSPLGQVKMMSLTHEFRSVYVPPIKADVLELPYKGGNFAMLILVPRRGTTLTDTIDKLKLISVTSIYTLLSKYGAEKMIVEIPRFKITSNLDNLKELASDMGLSEMFDESKANFTLLSDYLLYVSDLTQRASIEVTEEGTVAAAASTLQIESRMGYGRFVADKPFLFMIVHTKTEYVLFAGAYSKPSLF